MANKKSTVQTTNPGKVKQEILGQLNSSSLRSISMRHALVETSAGTLEGEPKSKEMRQAMLDAVADTESAFAVLTEVSSDRARWSVKRSCVIDCVETVEIGYGSAYEAADGAEFRQWSRLAVKTLEESGRNPKQIRIPGKLCFSVTGKIVFGWEEDAKHPDAMLLAVGEVMST